MYPDETASTYVTDKSAGNINKAVPGRVPAIVKQLSSLLAETRDLRDRISKAVHSLGGSYQQGPSARINGGAVPDYASPSTQNGSLSALESQLEELNGLLSDTREAVNALERIA